MDKYYVINNSDGDTTVTEFTKEDLLAAIEDGELGMDANFYENLPKKRDTNYWGEGMLIIKGSIVSPTPKQIITEYDLE